MTISLFVPGVPKPGGSKRAFYNAKAKRAMIVDACKDSAAWKDTVRLFASQAYHGEPLIGAIGFEFCFVMPRPKYHFNSKGELKRGAGRYHTVKPDATKLTRSTEDALTGIIWRDDSSIASQLVQKVYGDRTGVHIKVFRIESEGLK